MKTVVIISRDIVLTNLIDRALKNIYRILIFSNIQSALDFIYSSMPNLIVIELNEGDKDAIQHINNLKEEPVFRQMPILIIAGQGFATKWQHLLVEDYIRKPELEKEIVLRSELCILRSERVVEINPLTRLPGNISINRQIQERIDHGEIFSFGYADLDYFKPFNDKYGFSRGDEIIRITGHIIFNIVRNKQPKGSFVGHVGGDDFVFITDIHCAELAAAEIIDAFDRIVPTLYDPADRELGTIQSYDRQGILRNFPVMTISIGITAMRGRSFSHYGEITEAASEMKKYAKQFKESCFKSDRRQNGSA